MFNIKLQLASGGDGGFIGEGGDVDDVLGDV